MEIKRLDTEVVVVSRIAQPPDESESLAKISPAGVAAVPDQIEADSPQGFFAGVQQGPTSPIEGGPELISATPIPIPEPEGASEQVSSLPVPLPFPVADLLARVGGFAAQVAVDPMPLPEPAADLVSELPTPMPEPADVADASEERKLNTGMDPDPQI